VKNQSIFSMSFSVFRISSSCSSDNRNTAASFANSAATPTR
jgi:hypothetical protein